MLTTNLEQYSKDYLELAKLFKVTDEDITTDFVFKDRTLFSTIIIAGKTYINKEEQNDLTEDKFIKRFSKIHLYKSLSQHYQKSLPWGALTGVHPTAIAYEYYDKTKNYNITKRTLIKDFALSESKADLLIEVMQNQKCIIRNDKLIDLYVHIPFCVSRCTYCSFYSNDINKCAGTVEAYIDALLKELCGVKELLAKNNYLVKSVYIGGGTPTSLSAEQLEVLLQNINYPVNEFTVECGRPDTITDEKLKVLKKYGVTRISINPQTFCDKTLKTIGRKHTAEDVVNAYKLAMTYGFDVNMDLIAGLPNESMRTFKKSLDTTLEFAPDNITVHTLAIKRGAMLEEGDLDESGSTTKMVDYAREKLGEHGYSPYYLYRQRNITDGLENVGYCQKNKECKYNIDTVEECSSIMAVGSGAISKKLGINGEISRQANSKELYDYMYRVDEYLQKKAKLFIK